MKKQLLCTSAIALGIAAAPAAAQEWNLDWGGYMNQHVAFGDISDNLAVFGVGGQDWEGDGLDLAHRPRPLHQASRKFRGHALRERRCESLGLLLARLRALHVLRVGVDALGLYVGEWLRVLCVIDVIYVLAVLDLGLRVLDE